MKTKERRKVLAPNAGKDVWGSDARSLRVAGRVMILTSGSRLPVRASNPISQCWCRFRIAGIRSEALECVQLAAAFFPASLLAGNRSGTMDREWGEILAGWNIPRCNA